MDAKTCCDFFGFEEQNDTWKLIVCFDWRSAHSSGHVVNARSDYKKRVVEIAD